MSGGGGGGDKERGWQRTSEREWENEKVVGSRREFLRENDVGEVAVGQRCRRVKKRQQSSCHVKKGWKHTRALCAYIETIDGSWMEAENV